MTNFPREAYTSQHWFDDEQTGVLGKTWSFAGLESDFKDAGDFVTVQSGAFPLLAIRLKDGSLAAFHNICRHRGATLVEGTGNTGKSLTCPYHRWTYDLDGRLKRAPNMATCFPDLDRENLSLKPASIGIFNRLVFVNASPDADFETWIAPLKDKAWPHDLTAKDIFESAPLIYEMTCNWKVFVENAIDGYHLAYLHEKTLGGPKPGENMWEKCGDHYLWYATEEAGVKHALPAKSRKEYKAFLTKPIKATLGKTFAGVYYLFPRTIIDATPYTFSISTLHPTSAGTTRMTVRHWLGPGQRKDNRKYIPGYDAKTGIISSDGWTKPALETGDFQTEDVWICEKLQRGLNSPAFELGPLAKGAGAEDPIKWFHEALSAVKG